MNDALRQTIDLDLMPLLAAVLSALSCALIGNFLILRREAMLADAISHAVLPGLAIAFIITGNNTTFPMLAGAAIAGVACALLISLVQRAARLEAGASMGVVFSIMFAIGVVLIARTARQTHIDADCVLYGQLELLSLSSWSAPDTLAAFLTPGAWADTPRQVTSLAITALLTLIVIATLFKELRLVAFDPQLATALGFRAGPLNLLLMTIVALAVVASFEAVGVILVVAMLTCPPAIARLLTNRLRTQIALSAIIAAALALAGYWIAAYAIPRLTPPDVTGAEAAGTIAALSGIAVLLAAIFSPTHGLAAAATRRTLRRISILREDLLALLYRIDEARGQAAAADLHLNLATDTIAAALAWSRTDRLLAAIATRSAIARHEVTRDTNRLTLTDKGRTAARSIVRSHRLWETYLVRVLGLRPDHVHDTAMQLEHVTSPELADRLAQRTDQSPTDPHGKPIPQDPQPN